MNSLPVTGRTLAGFALACFLAAWFLPALSEVPGWMAFRYAMSPLWHYKGASADGFEQAVPYVLSGLTNVVFVVLFGLLAANRIKRPGLYFRVAIACFVMNLYWFVQLLRDGSVGDLLVGYYVWLVAFALQIAIGWMLMHPRK